MRLMQRDPYEQIRSGNRFQSRITTWVLLAFIAIGAFFLITEHTAHLLGILPYLVFLLCPLMMLFMHGRHGGHGGSDHRGEQAEPREYYHQREQAEHPPEGDHDECHRRTRLWTLAAGHH